MSRSSKNGALFAATKRTIKSRRCECNKLSDTVRSTRARSLASFMHPFLNQRAKSEHLVNPASLCAKTRPWQVIVSQELPFQCFSNIISVQMIFCCKEANVSYFRDREHSWDGFGARSSDFHFIEIAHSRTWNGHGMPVAALTQAMFQKYWALVGEPWFLKLACFCLSSFACFVNFLFFSLAETDQSWYAQIVIWFYENPHLLWLLTYR